MFLDSVENVFGTRNLYEVLGVSKDSKVSVVKKAYHKLSLRVHPDRVKPEEVESSTKKFQILCKIYTILSDDNKRCVYDDTGCIEDDEGIVQDRNWNEHWRLFFRKVTMEDIVEYAKKYKKSDEEKKDLKSIYLTFKGDMDKIMDGVMCATIDDEPRFRGMIAEWIAEGSVPSYPAFVGESVRKQKKRKRKFEKEAIECEELKEELGIKAGENSLTALIQARQATREKESDTFFDKLEDKYATKTKKSKVDEQIKNKKRKSKNK